MILNVAKVIYLVSTYIELLSEAYYVIWFERAKRRGFQRIFDTALIQFDLEEIEG